ncbi:MAG TPA: demethylmenaquinone methyltransferase [Dermatophilaceae bacterium]|nr:demethylmenaquinone methyltransferase [Dermatophilaceae bacterium]
MSRAHLDKRPSDVAAMFDSVAARYDLTNEVLSGGQAARWRRLVSAAVRVSPGQRVLDVAAGTGTSSMPFAKAGADIAACDFSLGMLRAGRRRHPGLTFVAADATALPFADAVFDAVTISFGLRNVVDVSRALGEFRRVTRPGGRLVVCEFSRPTHPGFRAVYLGYLTRVLPRVAAAVSSDAESYHYLAESIQGWPDQRDLAVLIRQSGWDDVEWRNVSGGIVALHRAARPG